MGISILIPVFNFDVSKLVFAISTQLELLNDTANELILLDDFSDKKYQEQYEKYKLLEFVNIFFSDKNLGRIGARKKLSSLAKNEHILFLDCDSEIINKNFIANYVGLCNNIYDVVIGGRSYTSLRPSDSKKLLHWKYGVQRESKERKNAFLSNNFMIKKSIFDSIPTIDALSGYGHEDTYWGIWFEQNNYKIKEINNKVLHLGIENNLDFLTKTNEALLNLKTLSNEIDNKLLAKHVVLFKMYSFLNKSKLLSVFYKINYPFLNLIKKQILSANPNIALLNYYKLLRFIKIMMV